MPLQFKGFIFQATTESDYDSATVQWQLSSDLNSPTNWDILNNFQSTYTQYAGGKMADAWDYCQTNGCVRHTGPSAYTYWRLVQGDVLIQHLVYNSTTLRKLIQNSVTVWARYYAYFDGLTGASPSSYTTQDVLQEDNVVSPGSPTKSGYAFTGFSPSLPRTVAADTTFTAQWQYAPQTPTITYNTKTSTSISFYVTNNAPYEAVIYYEQGGNPPDASYVILAANTQSSLLTISGLTPSTSYTIYAQAYKVGYYSGVDSITQTTLAVKTSTPTIDTPYFTTSWRYTVKNNDASTATVYSDFNGTNPPTTSRGVIAAGANTAVIITGYGIGGFYVYARAQASGEDMSDTASYYIL